MSLQSKSVKPYILKANALILVRMSSCLVSLHYLQVVDNIDFVGLRD